MVSVWHMCAFLARNKRWVSSLFALRSSSFLTLLPLLITLLSFALYFLDIHFLDVRSLETHFLGILFLYFLEIHFLGCRYNTHQRHWTFMKDEGCVPIRGSGYFRHLALIITRLVSTPPQIYSARIRIIKLAGNRGHAPLSCCHRHGCSAPHGTYCEFVCGIRDHTSSSIRKRWKDPGSLGIALAPTICGFDLRRYA